MPTKLIHIIQTQCERENMLQFHVFYIAAGEFPFFSNSNNNIRIQNRKCKEMEHSLTE